ncbi:hypothetical protein FOMG_20020 [Fusarium oxysporum f. sp. melonis 26406]|uniref:Uncharacterized protein n=1 Tax=Fusarium oxysporum f. sp. melonis 26406 TaxID=1089452 RepID=W9YUF1_FUSOX|nr:hypothetical protein FOMG_20020 [Fusarium oxysporum f. sp. melonis 26406]
MQPRREAAHYGSTLFSLYLTKWVIHRTQSNGKVTKESERFTNPWHKFRPHEAAHSDISKILCRKPPSPMERHATSESPSLGR